MGVERQAKPPLLEVEGLTVRFFTRDGILHAVRDVAFNLHPGESLGIVGESGCGKSVTALSILRLIPEPPGKIEARKLAFEGMDLLQATEGTLREIRGNRISMIFQDPMTSLNPVLTVEQQMAEIIKLHMGIKGKELASRCVELLKMVGISEQKYRLKSYPHQLSGGMRQRIMVAMAISCHPQIILADEPTTALDVTIQDQILHLIRSLAERLNTATILITHNLGVVAGKTDRIIVMYAGKIVEMASTAELFQNPQHPYTLGLLKSIPRVDLEEVGKLYSIKGALPNPMHPLPGCSFSPRCESPLKDCGKIAPPLKEKEPDHFVACWRATG